MDDLAIRANEPLKPWTTFKIGGPAKFFVEAETPEDFRRAISFARNRELAIFILGGGSNLLVSDSGFDGLVIHPAGKGVTVEPAESGHVRLRVAAGEIWDHTVGLAVERELWGIENLSHIPGQAGAALVQNIGAYGQQISDVLESAEVIEIESGNVHTLNASECGFGYRRSIFNSTARNQFVILSLTLRLNVRGRPNLGYPDVKAWFSERSNANPSAAEIREAIIQIRDRKFPFPREEKGGNAGSFFKNLTLNEVDFHILQTNLVRNFHGNEIDRLDQIRSRSEGGAEIKVPTAFLIEICGLKRYQSGAAQVNVTQPLVLLNRGGATAADVLAVAAHVRRTIYLRTGMNIELEPELVGFDRREIQKLFGFGA